MYIVLSRRSKPFVATVYRLTITNAFGCSASDDVKVEVQDLVNNSCILEPMLAFTPDGDGINDRWIIWRGNCSNNVHVTVFNRYGGIVFESEHYQNNWYGKYKGKELPDGTYYFYVEYTLDNGHLLIKRNNVTILR